MTSQQIRQFIAQNQALDAADLPPLDGYPEYRRVLLAQINANVPPIRDLAMRADKIGGVQGAWFDAPGARDDHALLYLHGGALVSSSSQGHSSVIWGVACATRRKTFALDYRLAPEHPFPAQYEDTIAAYRGLLDMGFRGDHIAVVGDSAGGGLALSLAMAIRDLGLPPPLGMVALSAWTDLAATGASHESVRDPVCTSASLKALAKVAAPNTDLRDPRLSPLYGDFAGLPPLLMQVGEIEILRDDTVAAARRAKEAGVEVTLEVAEGLPHVWPWFVPAAPESVQWHQSVASFLANLESRQAS